MTVTGDIDDDLEFTVVLSGRSGPLWTSTTKFTSPETRIALDKKVAVGDVTDAGAVEHAGPRVADHPGAR